MKKQLLTLVAMALLTSSACVAQDHQRGGRGQRGDMTERMKTELGLSDEQVAQLKEVYSQMRATITVTFTMKGMPTASSTKRCSSMHTT